MTSEPRTDAPARHGGRVRSIAAGKAEPAKTMGRGQMVGLAIAALAILSALVGVSDYVWPGGLPELRAEIERRPYVSGGGLIALEEAGVPMPLPGDLVAMYAGRTAPRDPLVLAGVLLLLETCVFIGSSLFFLAARRWARQLLRGRLGKIIHVTPERLAGAEAWFERRGAWAIVLARWIPGGRVPTTLTAALLGVDYPTFARAVLGSGLLWLGVCMTLGIMLGPTLDDLLTTHRALTAGVAAGIGFGFAAIAGARLMKTVPR